jgi:hypothetical protein
MPDLHKNFGLAGTNKMEYVAKVLNKDLSLEVDLVSPSWFSDNSNISDQIKNKYFTNIFTPKSIKSTSKLFVLINILISNIWLFFFLIFNVKKKEKILVYHSPWLSIPFVLAKSIKKFNLILEVEEIYADVWPLSKFFKAVERKIINIADSYLVVSEVLGKMLPEKPKVILYGTYWNIEISEKAYRESTNLEVVYCGAIDSYLGGAFNLVKSAIYLNKGINVNILGYAKLEEIAKLKKLIKEVNASLGRNAVIFHGLLHGDEFNNFLQKCDVGINPQNEGNHMNSAFPSKILTYLSNRLLVVSTNVLGVKESKIKDSIIFTENDMLNSIANALNSINNIDGQKNSNIISNLEKDFIFDFKNILK